MAKHKKTTEDRDAQTVIDGPALQQGAESDRAAQTPGNESGFDGNPRAQDSEHAAIAANARGEAQIAESGRTAMEAAEAARAYAQSEIDRSNAVAREQDQRALGKDGKPRESKAERFKRLAQKRVTKALAVLGHVQNLTNTNSYSYTPEQAQKIVDALVLAVNKIVDGFSGNKNGKVTFTL